jgi:hypothetical protein
VNAEDKRTIRVHIIPEYRIYRAKTIFLTVADASRIGVLPAAT